MFICSIPSLIGHFLNFDRGSCLRRIGDTRANGGNSPYHIVWAEQNLLHHLFFILTEKNIIRPIYPRLISKRLFAACFVIFKKFTYGSQDPTHTQFLRFFGSTDLAGVCRVFQPMWKFITKIKVFDTNNRFKFEDKKTKCRLFELTS